MGDDGAHQQFPFCEIFRGASEVDHRSVAICDVELAGAGEPVREFPADVIALRADLDAFPAAEVLVVKHGFAGAGDRGFAKHEAFGGSAGVGAIHGAATGFGDVGRDRPREGEKTRRLAE